MTTKLILHIQLAGCRRDDTEFLDNIGLWTDTQPGLFHTKIAGNSMVANEHWGKVNSSAPWSLSKVNSLLGRAPITVGWNSSKQPPFRETWELMQVFALPTNIRESARICSGESDCLDLYISDLMRLDDNDKIIKAFDILCTDILKKHANLREVSCLRQLPLEDRDLTFENIILFNVDALLLREFRMAIKCGDIGRVVNILWFWMLEFRGTGSMPKYADLVFKTLIQLKDMDMEVR
jgi:hypothetical protein